MGHVPLRVKSGRSSLHGTSVNIHAQINRLTSPISREKEALLLKRR